VGVVVEISVCCEVDVFSICTVMVCVQIGLAHG
jgi:hypothetical protein